MQEGAMQEGAVQEGASQTDRPILTMHETLCSRARKHAPTMGGRVGGDIGPVLRSEHFPSSGIRGIMHVSVETFWRVGDLGFSG